MKNKLWGGRFKKKADPGFERFSSSLKWDVRLLPYDLKIDAAHTQALKKCGVLSSGEASRLVRAISQLEKKYKQGKLRLNPSAEDVHSGVHAEIARLAGPVADKLHTARSRNDLVSQSSRLYCKHKAQALVRQLRALQRAIVSKAASKQRLLWPGMTHLQNAQVLSVSHILLAYTEMLERVVLRLENARMLADVCVLGSGALAGVTFPIDQRFLARKLELSRITDNSYDVSGDRDYILNLLFSLAFLSVQFSRISEDFLIWQTRGFSVVDIDEAFCTGSSMMPQKKNADFIELSRGAAGTLIGNFTGFVTLVKGLPTSYNRDLQWDKKFLFDSVETAEELLEIWTRVFRSVTFNAKKAEELLRDESLYATDLADYLVRKGVPFKTAHTQVGQIVRYAEAQGLPISRIGLDLLRKIAPKLGGDVYDLFDARHSVNLKKTVGSTNPKEIKKQIKKWEKILRA